MLSNSFNSTIRTPLCSSHPYASCNHTLSSSFSYSLGIFTTCWFNSEIAIYVACFFYQLVSDISF